MKYNKGFVALVVLLSILGVLTVGGVVYFAGKSSTPKNEVVDNLNYTPPTTNNNSFAQTPPATQQPQSSATTSFNCSTNFKKLLQITSPNGGESYHLGDTIHVQFKSCASMPLQNFEGIAIERYDLQGNYPSNITSGGPNGIKINLSYNNSNNNYLSNYQEQHVGNGYNGSFDVKIPSSGNMQSDAYEFINGQSVLVQPTYVGNSNIKYKFYLEGGMSETFDSSDNSDDYFMILP